MSDRFFWKNYNFIKPPRKSHVIVRHVGKCRLRKKYFFFSYVWVDENGLKYDPQEYNQWDYILFDHSPFNHDYM